MKGPRSRHKFNVLRIWECPACKARVFAPPQIVTRTCMCQGKDRATWMCLLDAKPLRQPPLSDKPDELPPS